MKHPMPASNISPSGLTKDHTRKQSLKLEISQEEQEVLSRVNPYYQRKGRWATRYEPLLFLTYHRRFDTPTGQSPSFLLIKLDRIPSDLLNVFSTINTLGKLKHS